MCVEGCFCPRSNTKGVALVWDDVNGKCSTVNDCPDVGTCDSTIETDYLDTGAHVAACKKTGSGDQCAPDTCLSGCTAANWDEAGAKYDVKCVREADAASCNKHKECQWAGDGTRSLPFRPLTLYNGKKVDFVCLIATMTAALVSLVREPYLSAPFFVQWGKNRLCVLGRHYAGVA